MIGCSRAIGAGLLASALLVGSANAVAAQAQLDLPPVPQDFNFLQDYAELLDPETRVEVGIVQQEAFEQHQTPIVVVTISGKGEYGGWEHSIEDFAREWFDHWEIGFTGEGGELRNQGILLLVSRGDRAARIELGADWGRGWDGYAQEIMDEQMVPAFARGDYNTGVTEGVWGLLDMAARGPEGTAPGHLSRIVHAVGGRAFMHTPVPVWVSLLLGLVGLGMVVQSQRKPEPDNTLLLLGLTLLVGAFIFWVLLFLIVVIFQSHFGNSSGGGGFGSAGGFGGGGFSGGGGATGRW